MKDIFKSGLILLSAAGAIFIGMKLPKYIYKYKVLSKARPKAEATFEPSKINFC